MCKLLQLINLSEIKLYRCLSAKDGKTYDQCLLIGIDLLDLANRFRKRTCSNANSVANFYTSPPMPIARTSASVRGTGLEPGPTKLVTPLVLRTTYHVSSFMIIFSST